MARPRPSRDPVPLGGWSLQRDVLSTGAEAPVGPSPTAARVLSIMRSVTGKTSLVRKRISGRHAKQPQQAGQHRHPPTRQGGAWLNNCAVALSYYGVLREWVAPSYLDNRPQRLTPLMQSALCVTSHQLKEAGSDA